VGATFAIGSKRHRLEQTPVRPLTETADAAVTPSHATARYHEHQIERLIDRLPSRVQTTIRWLHRPSSRWARIPAGVLLVVGGLLSILPLLGLWMLPLGLMLLADDAPPLRRARDRVLDRIEGYRPHWFSGNEAETTTRTSPELRPSHSLSVAGGESHTGSQR
jgi:hypothetical protein